MKDLVVRLAAPDPDAGDAVPVIAYFDQLTEARAGLRAIGRSVNRRAGSAFTWALVLHRLPRS